MCLCLNHGGLHQSNGVLWFWVWRSKKQLFVQKQWWQLLKRSACRYSCQNCVSSWNSNKGFSWLKKKTCFCSSLNSFHSQMIWFVDLTGSSPEIDRRFIRQAFCLLLKIFWDYLLDSSSRRVTEEQGKKGPQVRFRTLVCGADVCA